MARHKMNEQTAQKLDRAINSLLTAGYTTTQIRTALSPQASFGKYDGCTPYEIEERAKAICSARNAAAAARNAAVMKELRGTLRDLRQQFAGFTFTAR